MYYAHIHSNKQFFIHLNFFQMHIDIKLLDCNLNFDFFHKKKYPETTAA